MSFTTKSKSRTSSTTKTTKSTTTHVLAAIDSKFRKYDPHNLKFPCLSNLKFQEELLTGEEVATCPSCSLIVKVIYDQEAFQEEQNEVTKLSEDLKKLEVTK